MDRDGKQKSSLGNDSKSNGEMNKVTKVKAPDQQCERKSSDAAGENRNEHKN